MPYAEAMAKYGSDKPDLRFGLEIVDVSHVWVDAAFNAFRKIVSEGGVVRALVIPGAARTRARELDALVDQAKQLGAVGIMWARKTESGHQHERQGRRRGQAARDDGGGGLQATRI